MTRRLWIAAYGTGLAIALASAQVAGAAGAARPAEAGGLIGVGVKSCDDFSLVEVSAGRGDDTGILAVRRHEDWAAGFVSGLNFAAGRDFLRDVPFAGFMRRVAQHCADHPRDDFFTAVNTILKQLNTPEQE